MIKKKDYPPDTGNIIESVYAGVEHPAKKSNLKKKIPKMIKTVDDIHESQAKQKKTR